MNTKTVLFFYWLPVVGWMALIFYVSMYPAKQLPNLQGSDKLIHLVVYGVLSYGLCRALARSTALASVWIVVLGIVVSSIYGASDEIHQLYTGRCCELGDLSADMLGALLASCLWYLLMPAWVPTWLTGRTCQQKGHLQEVRHDR